MKRHWLLTMLVLLGMVLAACGPSGATPDPETGEIMLVQNDDEEGMNFEPETIVLTAGQRVRIVLENHGSKDHEFMLGKNVVYTEEGAPNGFEVDFFEGIEDQVDVQLGDGAMLMIDGETVAMGGMGMGMEGEEEGEMQMEGEEHTEEGEEAHEEEGMAMHMEDHTGWMVMDNAGSGTTVIEFVVPEDRVGEWEMACFEDDGTHYEDGMRGTLIVQAP